MGLRIPMGTAETGSRLRRELGIGLAVAVLSAGVSMFASAQDHVTVRHHRVEETDPAGHDPRARL